jgi:lipoyl(octanoyl) transferase
LNGVMICAVEQLGLIDYADALHLQREKVAARKAGIISDTLLLLEHPHVYTLGRCARREHLLVSDERIAALDAKVFDTDRGGDITYHGPGQLVGYPIFDLTQHRRDISWYMRSLEEVFIRVAAEYGIRAERIVGMPGVWVGNDKLVALGVHVSRWVTSHGFAFNVNTDLSYFSCIVPCGMRNKGVTSLRRLTGKPLAMASVAKQVIEHFAQVFHLEVTAAKESSRNGTVPLMESAPSLIH